MKTLIEQINELEAKLVTAVHTCHATQNADESRIEFYLLKRELELALNDAINLLKPRAAFMAIRDARDYQKLD